MSNAEGIPLTNQSSSSENHSIISAPCTKQLDSYSQGNSILSSEEKLRLFMSAVKDYAMIMLDPTGRIVSWNEGACRMKGYQAEEVLGKHFSLLYSDRDVQAHLPQTMLDEAREKGSVQTEGERKRKDGSFFWAGVLISAIRNDSGELIGFAKITRDLTEAKKASDEIKQLMDQRENFVAALTHDLKTPILAANRAIKLLLDGDFGPVTGGQTEILQTVLDSNDAMYGLVSLLLEVYRYDSGSKQLSVSPTDLNELVTSAAKILKPLAEEKSIDLTVHGEDSLQPVLCDPAEVTRVVQNLIGNALKFTPAGGSVAVDVLQNGGLTKVKVQDTGLGIEPKVQSGLFKRFFQPAGGGRTQAGTGLGLYLSRSIIEAHGGTIGFESQPGKGSMFFFTLPNKR